MGMAQGMERKSLVDFVADYGGWVLHCSARYVCSVVPDADKIDRISAAAHTNRIDRWRVQGLSAVVTQGMLCGVLGVVFTVILPHSGLSGLLPTQ